MPHVNDSVLHISSKLSPFVVLAFHVWSLISFVSSSVMCIFTFFIRLVTSFFPISFPVPFIYFLLLPSSTPSFLYLLYIKGVYVGIKSFHYTRTTKQTPTFMRYFKIYPMMGVQGNTHTHNSYTDFSNTDFIFSGRKTHKSCRSNTKQMFSIKL
jgi:hypothetical protein